MNSQLHVQLEAFLGLLITVHVHLSFPGKFSTRPYDVRFFLSDIVEHMPNAIPCQAMLFVHSDTASELPKHLVTAVVSLTESNMETSLIATNTEVDDFTDAPMFDIPLDLDIEVVYIFHLPNLPPPP